MRRLTLGVATILLGLVGAGCSLPEVYPLAGGPTGGPSPYGAWYEQHWATNAILLTAAYRQEYGSTLSEAPPEEADQGEAAEAGATETAAPRPCCDTPGCPHHAAVSAESQSAEPSEAEPAAAPADDARDAPATVKPSGKVRY
ncbi:MAG: hypothetical protein HY899_10665 [Deltaproteobacteria bacterium]|nr:hypothetical protein [Deltaproteobacteria bacterium]